jgi:ABC-type nitrate/sulfonate/bicarbonate transport system substrate-binding protein
METVRLAYRDDDRTPVIYCIREMALRHYGIDVEVLRIKDYGEFESAIFDGSADVLIDHVEFLYAEAAKGRGITFFCAPKIVRGLELVVPQHISTPEELAGKTMAVRDSGRPYAVNLWLRMMGLEDKVEIVIVPEGQVGRWKQWKKVISGECVACFVDPLYLSDALDAGLHVLQVPDLHAVGHYAQACTSEFARKNYTRLQNYVKAVVHALCLAKHDKQAAMKIVAGEPMKRMQVENLADMEKYFDAIVAKLQIKPYPTPEAIAHTYEIAVKEYGAQGINPMSLWDLHWVKTLDDEGFIDRLIEQMPSR